MDEDTPLSRRSVLGTGAFALASLAGCLGGRGDPTPTPIVERPAGQQIDETTDRSCEMPETRDSDDPLVVDFDSRRAFGCRGRLLDGFENVSPWDTYEGSVGGDLSRVAGGTQSVRLSSRDGSRAWMYRRFEDGIDLSDRDVSLAVHPGEGETRVAEFRLQLLAPDRSNRVEMWHGIDGVDGWTRLDSGPTQFVGDPDLTDVREFRVQALAGEAEAVSCNVDELRTTPKLSEPGVVITFDGAHSTQYQHAFPIMRKYGFAGAVGVTPRRVGEYKRLDGPRLADMRDAGWDVVSNPQPDRPLPELSDEEQEKTLTDAKRWLVERGFEDGARFVHWPNGRVDSTTLDLGAKYHYMGFLDGQSPTGRITDPLTVGRVDGDDVERTLETLERAVRSRQLVVVEYHTVGAVNDNRTTIEEFSRTMRRIDELGLRVLTPSELWEMQSSDLRSSA